MRHDCLLCGVHIDNLRFMVRFAEPEESYWHWLLRHAKGFIRGPFIKPNANRTGYWVCEQCRRRLL